MGILFRLYLAYDTRFGIQAKLIKNLRKSSDPKDIHAAELIQAQLDERKRNPPKDLQEFMRQAVAISRQAERDMRISGRHGEADQLAKMIDQTEQNTEKKSGKRRR